MLLFHWSRYTFIFLSIYFSPKSLKKCCQKFFHRKQYASNTVNILLKSPTTNLNTEWNYKIDTIFLLPLCLFFNYKHSAFYKNLENVIAFYRRSVKNSKTKHDYGRHTEYKYTKLLSFHIDGIIFLIYSAIFITSNILRYKY